MKLLRQLRNVMTSADTAWPQPDGIAVTPAIGPLPAILVPADLPDAHLDPRRSGRVEAAQDLQ
jgi:hypothetical protein